MSQYPGEDWLTYLGKWQIFKIFPDRGLGVNFPQRRQRNRCGLCENPVR